MAWADEDLTMRNFQTLSEGLKSVRAKNEKLEEILKKTSENNGNLQNQVNELTQKVNVMFARLMGNGRTT